MIIESAPDATWKALIALNRLMGFRVPSEIQALKWNDIDLPRGDLHIRAKKTKHTAKGGIRTAPILPELRPYLVDLWAECQPGVQCELDSPVFARYADATGAAITNKFVKILKKANVSRWPNLFSNGRKSAITDLLAANHSVTDVANWVGNSPSVIWEFYAMAQEESRRRAASGIPVENLRTTLRTNSTGIDGPQGQLRESEDIKKAAKSGSCVPVREETWALRDSNPRPSRCKRDALAN